MKGLPAAIMDENGGWSTAYWYPHAPPTAHVFRHAHIIHLLQVSRQLGKRWHSRSITFTSRTTSVTIPRCDATGPAGELTVELSGCTRMEEGSDNDYNRGQELKLGSHVQHSVTISYVW